MGLLSPRLASARAGWVAAFVPRGRVYKAFSICKFHLAWRRDGGLSWDDRPPPRRKDNAGHVICLVYWTRALVNVARLAVVYGLGPVDLSGFFPAATSILLHKAEIPTSSLCYLCAPLWQRVAEILSGGMEMCKVQHSIKVSMARRDLIHTGSDAANLAS